MSNTIGSNVFDILVGLGVPWAIQTMCVSYGSEVRSLFTFCTRTPISSTPCYCECMNRNPLTPLSVKDCRAADDLLFSPSCVLQVMINSRGLVYSVVLLLGSVALTVSNS